MAGIYIHIPFCNSKCAYCGFYSIASQKQKSAFLEALHSEIAQRTDYLKGEEIDTIYFGGGTPSILSIEEIKGILECVSRHNKVNPAAEITLEANPDTLNPEYLQGLRKLGINKLSIGIQSFFDDDLKYLSRRHDANHARQCIGWAKQAGFDNLTLDLIYGLPTATSEKWSQNLDLFFETGAQHLSAYALTVEPNTIMAKQITAGKLQPVNEDDAVREYEILCQRAKENGFLHYEISNFAKPGFRSKHNCSYWNRTPYAGFGPSAHSFDGTSRQWNVDNISQYIEYEINPSPNTTNPSPITKEILMPEQAYDEYVMLKLRTAWGIDLKYMEREMGKRFSDYCLKQAQILIAQGKVTQTREFLHLTDAQMLFADGIAETLFWE
ncbi:MAG: radical SAM family heme chaperone HemW [Bacteroidales bacterium]|nr:radical SAM family heme chaperone HemW [Bacteroidales bacterium]